MPLESDTEYALTDRQEQALVRIYESGYYRSSGGVMMSDPGDELGIS